jgi:RNA polymerase sigma-70 factor (ECF subfamily)
MTPTIEPGPARSDGDPTDWLLAAGQGDQQAFARLYDELAPLVYGLVLRVTRNRAIAEEVSQEVFLEVWRLARRFDADRGTARSWVTAIAHRRAVDRVRSEQAARNREDREGRRVTPGPEPVADQIVTLVEHERVWQALSQLNEAQREALVLAFYGGHSYSRVAKILDQPEGTVKSRIRDGLRKVRHLLEVMA